MSASAAKTTNDFASFADIVIVFRKSRSAMYPVALRLARSAQRYREGELGGTLFHVAGFGKSPEELEHARTLLGCDGARDLQVYVDNRLTSRWDFAQVLGCYLRSCRCVDWRAHCQKVVTKLFSDERSELGSVSLRITLTHIESENNEPPAKRYLFPCGYILERTSLKVERNHPASPGAQIQALAVKLGCDLCPRFDARGFKELC